MADTAVSISITDAQMKVLRQLDDTKTAKQVLQGHVDTWLLPYVQEQVVADIDSVKTSYRMATTAVQAQVRQVLGLG